MIAPSPKPASAQVLRALCDGLDQTADTERPESRGASARAAASPFSVSGISLRPVCWPDSDHDARDIAFASGLELVEDEGLLEEVSGLVEWPQVLMGSFEEDYLSIPSEIIRLTIKTNQKCFVTRKQGEETLSNKFILASNIQATDGGKEIVHGVERGVGLLLGVFQLHFA